MSDIGVDLKRDGPWYDLSERVSTNGLMESSSSSVCTCVEFHLCPNALLAICVARDRFEFDDAGRNLAEPIAALTALSLAGVSIVYKYSGNGYRPKLTTYKQLFQPTF